MSVFAYLMRGMNDDNLTWPFTGKLTIELLNQLQDANHLLRHTHFPKEGQQSQRVYTHIANIGYGFCGFCTHSALAYNPIKNSQYLKDDCLSFRVKAETCSQKPWLVATGDFFKLAIALTDHDL